MTYLHPHGLAVPHLPVRASSHARLAGFTIFGSLVIGSLVFRTYSYEVTPLALEVVRHFGLFFVFCELVVIALALRADLDIASVWKALTRTDKTALTIWLTTFWIGSLLSAQPNYSLIAVVAWPVHMLFGVSVWHLGRQAASTTSEGNDVVGLGVLFVLMALLALTAIHFANAPEPAPLPGGTVFWAGAIPGFMSVRLFGLVAAYAGLFGAGILLAQRGTQSVSIGCFLLMLGFGAMCWSGTRAALLGFIVALTLVPIAARCRVSPRTFLTMTAILLFALGCSLAIPTPDANFGTLNLLFGGAAGNGLGAGDLTGGRIDIWRVAVSAIAQQPLIGHGEGSVRWLMEQQVGMHVQPHSILLQLPLHWGVPAAGAAMWLTGRLLLSLFHALRQDRAAMPYAMVVAASLVAAMFDGALYYPQMVMLPVAALAFALARVSTRDRDLHRLCVEPRAVAGQRK